MNQFSTATDYTQTRLGRTNLLRDHSKLSILDLDQVVAELRLLSKEVDISVDILSRIRDSLHELVLSVEEH